MPALRQFVKGNICKIDNFLYCGGMGEKPVTQAKQRLLERIKRAGSATTSELAREQGLTNVAVRQHLRALEANGLVEQKTLAAGGRGRPAMHWSLTALASSLFPDRHAELAVGLIRALGNAVGEEGLQRVIDERATEQVSAYAQLIPSPPASLRVRVEALANQRTAEGYMAEVVAEGDESYLLTEHHCPICDAAKSCMGLCTAELDVFRRALGSGVHVERVKHLLTGDSCCTYRIHQE